jgi:hypothetical protein
VVIPAGTVTLPGTLREMFSVLKLTGPPAAIERVTAQLADPSCARVAGIHEKEVTRTAVARSIATLRDEPLRDADNVAFSSAVMVLAVTAKEAVVAPEPTSAEVGALNNALLVDNLTEPPPLFDNVTVHVARSPVCSAVDEHVRDVMKIAGVNRSEPVCEDPFSEAVTAAVCSAGIKLPAIAVKVAVVAPGATNNEAGAESNPVLLEIATGPPPVRDSVTVHVLEPAAVRVDGAQASDVIVIGLVRVTVADFDEPFSVAVIVADWSLVTPLTVARNVAVVALGLTETNTGRVTEV